MLRGLDIRDLLIIDRLELDVQPGLNVLTGETGAGKSILLDALGFVLGWRGRAELVRTGASQGEVTAWFDLPTPHPVHEILAEAGLPEAEGGELVLRRINTAEGRKTAWVNDRRASGEVLRRISEHLVELHGQHDDRGLTNARGHRQLLDAFAGSDLDTPRKAWRDRHTALQNLAQAQTALAALKEEEDWLRHAVQELDDLDPQAGEEAELDRTRRRMQAAERLRDDILRARAAVSSEAAEGLVTDAIRWLDGAAPEAEGQLDAPLEALSRALEAIAEAEQGISAAIDVLMADPATLEATEERLFAIRGLARKHNVLPDDLPPFAEDLRARLSRLDRGADDIGALQQAKIAAETAYDQAAQTLTETRTTAARALDSAMATELAPLKMERALFATAIAPGDPGPEGRDQVEFTVTTNPGAPPGPLNRIASGGELSRFLLALKVCLTAGGTSRTMIFDEIDRGVGGATADAVGRRLAALAQEAQVLVVTHSPQVAALGGHHWRVEKRVADGMTTSTVVALDGEDRIDEVARMLAGDRITDEARAAARALLAG